MYQYDLINNLISFYTLVLLFKNNNKCNNNVIYNKKCNNNVTYKEKCNNKVKK